MCYSSNPNYRYGHHVDGKFECMDVLAAASCRRRSAKCTKEVPRERRAHIVDRKNVYMLPSDGVRVPRMAWTPYGPAFMFGSTTSL